MKGQIVDQKRKPAGEIELADEIFATKPSRPLLYEVVKQQMACRRKGTAASRNRTLVSGTTAKMYRQKGTGRARHGDMRANIFVGGGKAFGPHPRSYAYRLPKKVRKGGLRSALALKQQEGKLLIVDDVDLPEIKTKAAIAMLEALGVKSGLIVLDEPKANLEKSVRNIPNVKAIRWEQLNVYDLLRHDHAILEAQAVEKLEGVLKP